MEFIKAIIIGIVQGITEWLPVSSTGHMILFETFLHMDVSEAFSEMFRVVIQFGSILAVLILYFTKLNPFAKVKNAAEKKQTWSLWFKVIVAVIPSAVLGLLLDDWFDEHFYNYIVVAITLILYGVAFIVIENKRKNLPPKIDNVHDISYKTALGIGAFQVLSLIPGTSRSGSTIIGASLLGVSRTAAAEFSFFLAIPTMLGASALKILKYFMDGNEMFSSQEWGILIVGCAVAFVVSLVAIKALMNYVRRHSFSAFGVYRIILGAVVLGYYLITLI
ncbi:MAG: undecaprenyl-diphosphate phosphatase [Oscillospiraceae bacterium]|nr:undecaprenyl-diphosphate phosphatase [Oscillospiraceae bacterium]MBQ9857482.1 undecaprenyl-diphosphate phosphatase [Oscillospiraceae bacterium]